MGHYWKSHISRWSMVSQAWHAVTNPRLVARTFGLDIGIVRTVSVWRCCECKSNSSIKFDKTANMTPILNRWPTGGHFQRPYLSDFLCMVRGSSDLCRLCQFLWDSAEQTALSRNRRPGSGRRFPLVYMCVCQFIKRERESFGETRRWNRSVYCIYDLSRLILSNNTHILNFLMLEGVWIKVGTAKIFAKQNGGRFVEIVDLAPFDAQQGLLPCYNRDWARHQKLVLSISPRELVWSLTASGKYLTAPDRFPRVDWQHKFLVTGLNPFI